MAEDLSFTPQTVACAGCGTTTQTTEGWVIRQTEDGTQAFCPSCAIEVERALQQMSEDINMTRALLLGVIAVVAGSGIWYGLVVITDYKIGFVAIGIGWLVGKAVQLGAGSKRSGSLVAVSGLLTVAALMGGEYLTTNHLARKYVEGFTGWLTLQQFIAVYKEIATFKSPIFYLIALWAAVIQTRPLKLKS